MKELKIDIPEGYEIDSENSTFYRIVFKPINNLATWKDCVGFLKTKNKSFYYITPDSDIWPLEAPPLTSYNYNILPSRKIAEKFLTLQKLYTCRQAYIGDWKPDWSDRVMPKYGIVNTSNNIKINSCFLCAVTFSFPNKKLAEKFLNNFKEDLEFIKELL